MMVNKTWHALSQSTWWCYIDLVTGDVAETLISLLDKDSQKAKFVRHLAFSGVYDFGFDATDELQVRLVSSILPLLRLCSELEALYIPDLTGWPALLDDVGPIITASRRLNGLGVIGADSDDAVAPLDCAVSMSWACLQLTQLHLQDLAGSLTSPLSMQAHLTSLELIRLIHLVDADFVSLIGSLQPPRLRSLHVERCRPLTYGVIAAQAQRLAATLTSMTLKNLRAIRPPNDAPGLFDDIDDNNLFDALPNLSEVTFFGYVGITWTTFRCAKRLPHKLYLDGKMPWLTPVALASIICGDHVRRPKRIKVFRNGNQSVWTRAARTELNVCRRVGNAASC